MDADAQNDPLFPIAVLIDELKVGPDHRYRTTAESSTMMFCYVSMPSTGCPPSRWPWGPNARETSSYHFWTVGLAAQL